MVVFLSFGINGSCWSVNMQRAFEWRNTSGAVTLPHRWCLINKLQMWNDEALECEAGLKTVGTLEKSPDPRCQAMHMGVFFPFPSPWLSGCGDSSKPCLTTQLCTGFSVLQIGCVAQILNEFKLNWHDIQMHKPDLHFPYLVSLGSPPSTPVAAFSFSGKESIVSDCRKNKILAPSWLA